MPEHSKSEAFDKTTSGIKNTLQIAFLLIVLLGLFSSRVQQWLAGEFAFLTSAGVESIKVGELELKLKAAQNAVQTAVNHPPALPSSVPRPKPQDKPPTPGLAPALEVLPTPGTFWVYLGQFENGHFLQPPNFKAPTGEVSAPQAGQVLTATGDVYRRNAAPAPMGQAEWKLGDIVGVERAGHTITVRGATTVEGGYIWIEAAGGG